MKQQTSRGTRIIALLLTVCLCVGLVPVSAFAEDIAPSTEATEAQTTETQTPAETPTQPETTPETEAPGEEPGADTGDAAPAPVPQEADDGQTPAETQEDSGETTTEGNPFTLSASFAGQQLAGSTALSEVWDSRTAKTLRLTVGRDSGVTAVSGKQYILSLTVAEGFCFASVPTAAEITGAADTAFLKNSAAETEGAPEYGTLSGEFRVKLDPSAAAVSVPALSVRFCGTLAEGETRSAENPLRVKLVTVDEGTALTADLAAGETLQSLAVTAATVTAAAAEPSEAAETGDDSFTVDSFDVTVDVSYTDKDTGTTYTAPLTESGTALTGLWGNNTAMNVNVVVKWKNVTTNQTPVLRMKVPDVLQFTGLPDTAINGVESVKFVRNAIPTIQSRYRANWTNLGAYSGEIRVELNPDVEQITIPLSVSYNQELIGYCNTQTVSNPLTVNLVTVAKGTNLGSFTDADVAQTKYSASASSVRLDSGKDAFTWKLAISTDNFVNSSVLSNNVVLDKDTPVSYYIGNQACQTQVFGSLTIAVHCPYIEVDGTRYYLDFDANDAALTTDNPKGYQLAAAVTHDEDSHTLIFHYENICLLQHSPIVYTPQFRWPSALAELSPDETHTYKVQGLNIEVTEQTGYLGNATAAVASAGFSISASYIASGADVRLVSSAEAEDGMHIAKRVIYKGLTPDKKIRGTLGFFDIHNEGVTDSGDLNITVTFNTASTGAQYYVTRMYLPMYGADKTKVSYTLTDGKTGEKEVTRNGILAEFIPDLSEGQYIKSLSYTTKLQAGVSYHQEIAHSWRNRYDSGLFFGYMTGDVGQTASATFTIQSADGSQINKAGDTSITAVETSTIGDDDSIGMAISSDAVKVNNNTSASVTAGNSVRLSFSGSISSEEYPLSGNTVNGYNVMRDGMFYVCLPDGVSVSGTEAVTVTSNGAGVAAQSVKRLTDYPVSVSDTKAYWWEISAPGMNTRGGQSFTVSLNLSTSATMKGLDWNFANNIVVRPVEQYVSWTAANRQTELFNSVEKLRNYSAVSTKKLADYLDTVSASKLGMVLHDSNGVAKLTIVRAEAKLDVETSFYKTSAPTDTKAEISLSDSADTVVYEVDVKGTEGGAAKDFEYYIPIAYRGDDAVLNANTWVSRNEFGLSLADAVQVSAVEKAAEEIPFEVYYTTDRGLSSTTVRQDSVTWTKTPENYAAVTAIRIVTTESATVKTDERFVFQATLRYDGKGTSYDSEAGSLAQWRSFGHYTYINENDEETTNTYPSATNTVKVHVTKDYTAEPFAVSLDTALAEGNSAAINEYLGLSFTKAQTLRIKSYTASGVQLSTDSPAGLTGADANSTFRMAVNLNNLTSTILPAVERTWSLAAGTELIFQTQILFSRALTDVTTDRHVDIVIGNDDVELTFRVKLVRVVAAASADKSGVAVGEHFQVPNVSTACSIAQNAAFTALYVVENFVPGNYTAQTLSWLNSAGSATAFPSGTTVTMMTVDETSAVTGLWYLPVGGSAAVDLSKFIRMAGTETFTYDKTTTTPTTLRYLFVVNFGLGAAPAGEYKLAFNAAAKDSSAAFQPVALPVTVTGAASFGLSAAAADPLTASVSYTVSRTSGNDSYLEGKALALVLTPTTALPQDAKLLWNGTAYDRNGEGTFILPIGEVQSGTGTLELQSKMLPETAASYTFTAALYLGKSRIGSAPCNGTNAAAATVTLTKAADASPALKPAGTRVATLTEWNDGMPFTLDMANIPTGGTVTVNAYAGITGSSRVTDLLASVGSAFTFSNGTGTWNGGALNGKLSLSPAAKTGTYRLVFEVKDANGKTQLSVPYYLVVKE